MQQAARPQSIDTRRFARRLPQARLYRTGPLHGESSNPPGKTGRVASTMIFHAIHIASAGQWRKSTQSPVAYSSLWMQSDNVTAI
ncbi:hypothetical protein ACFFJ7_06040 [Pseudochelatococcus lubricantis]|uniref:hypothetical protein n=1 Tax=Pseudochelatococcus lubricantis TaxID=1538102 RepID=UPI0035EA222F